MFQKMHKYSMLVLVRFCEKPKLSIRLGSVPPEKAKSSKYQAFGLKARGYFRLVIG